MQWSKNHAEEAVPTKTAFAQLRIEEIACVLVVSTLQKKKKEKKERKKKEAFRRRC